ncbi:oligopeptide ABC transporter ATP-binding protein OppD [Rosenbergiella australiborealis]|uniref:Glutathione import ATP-binding protein GsiA n=2 Tax=Rosenbergiella TaxID=1356488 RepID=A0ABS5T493_9GAMM|nr:dipeptide ABC transporter ATP-binding protein [Rosenbergiella australiborealis]MBT0727180.1 oligopeptide ABC transporter ATP-binding protein OppD [Rosenbergiella australiborealis]
MVMETDQQASQPQPVLQVENLQIAFPGETTPHLVVDHLNLTVHRGETLALVGESGSGKSVSSLALMGLLPNGTKVTGSRWLQKRDGQRIELGTLSDAQWQKVRGADVAMIFQEPMTSLNPVFTIADQLAEALRQHQHLSASQAQHESLQLLERVRIPAAKQIMQRYPHQLSGGMRQRVMIAMALSCRPALLIADEPTTALDVTLQAEILALIRELQRDLDTGVLFITHDMGVVAEMANRVTVLRHGVPLETAPVKQLFQSPQHTYTQQLLAAVPRLGDMKGHDFPEKFHLMTDAPSSVPAVDTVDHHSPPLLQVKDLVMRFPIRAGIFNRVVSEVHAVEHLSFDLRAGETLALVGESGCGKSTTGRALLQLVASQQGSITFNGQRVDQLTGSALNTLRQEIQFIFQDPYASLDPRKTVGYSIMEPLLIHRLASRSQAEQRVKELLEKVGLSAEHAQRYPHQFSGGQRQRICIARALALNPKLIVADESVSALDVSVQAQIINLLLDLQRETGMAFLFISHDMAVVERISHRVAVMYQGQIVEIGPRAAVFTQPQHPYTQKLLRAVPVADPTVHRPPLSSNVEELPSAIYPVGKGPERVNLHEVSPGHFVAHSIVRRPLIPSYPASLSVKTGETHL